MSVLNLYNFRESRFTALSHELRVYIFGADVTPWLKGDLSITYGNRDSFNSCSFELSNPRKIWQITRANLEGKWRQDVGEYSERAKLSVFQWKNSNAVNPSFNLNINTVILGQKDDETSNVIQPGPNRIRPTEKGTERRFRLAVNDCIFSRQDPMRIFMRNPYTVKNPKGEWVEIYCGYVHDHPITTNYQTGESTLRISGYCIRQLLTKMRVQLNRLAIQADPQPVFSRSFFADFIAPSTGKHPFATSTLEKTIKELILGTATPTTGEVAKTANGIGQFRMGNVICYDAKSPLTTLERWHLMTVFGVNKVPFPTGPSDDLWLTTDEMVSLGEITRDVPNTYSQGPGGRFLHFLLPTGGTGAGALMQSTLDAQGPRTIEWTTRWEIIREFAGKLDFQVTTSPSGDILVEFPLYGFTPHVFSTQGGIEVRKTPMTYAEQQQAAQAGSSATGESKAVKEQQAYEAKQRAIAAGYSGEIVSETDAANAKSVAKVTSDIDEGVTPFGLGAFLTFDLHQLEDTLNDEAEDFPTILQVDGGMALQQANVTGKEEALTNLRAFVYSPVLVSRFGIIAEQMSIPFAGQRSKDLDGGGGSMTNSPVAKRMAKLALIEYMKRLADASTWDGTVVYRPFLFPNRPVWLRRSARMGLLTSVTNRWSIGKSASTNFSMHMLMSERYDPNDGANPHTEYRLPTGASNMPIDYKNIWADVPESEGQPESGVIATVGTKTPPSADANGGQGSVGSGTAAPNSSASSSPLSKSNTKIPLRDPTFMYKPFSDAIAAAIEKAAKEGIVVQVTSTYRDPKKQEAMKKDPGAWGVKKINGKFVQVAEPWKSTHQYGMGVDVAIVGDKKSDYRRFAEICGDNIYWGGSYGDDVHYEWSTQPPGDTGLQARAFAEAYGTDKPDYLKHVWKQFDTIQSTPVTAEEAATPGSPWNTVLKVVGLGPTKRTESSNTVADTAEDCTEATLTKRGLDTIADVKG